MSDIKQDEVVADLVAPLTKSCPSKWVLGLAAISIGVYFHMLQDNIAVLTEKLKTEVESNVILTDNISTLTNTIDAQNKSIEDAAAQAAAIQAESVELADKLIEQRIESEKKVATLMKGKKPKNCKESVNYLRTGVKDLQWSK